MESWPRVRRHESHPDGAVFSSAYHIPDRTKMDFYEELGITRDATEEDIRRSHRRLIKLLHPDGQTDEELKEVAGVQLRRVNSMVDTLIDGERRSAYDQQLAKGGNFDLFAISSPARPEHFLTRPVPWWLLSVVVAVLLTIIAVLTWANLSPRSHPIEITTEPVPKSTKGTPSSSIAPVIAPSQTVATVPAQTSPTTKTTGTDATNRRQH